MWDVGDQRVLWTIDPDLDIPRAATFSRDGSRFVCSGIMGIAVYETSQYKIITYVRGDCAVSVAIHHENELLAMSNSHLGLIRLWNITANREVAVLSQESLTPWSTDMAFDANGKLLILSDARSVRLWHLVGGNERLTTSGHAGGVCGVTFSPDGTEMASSSKDRTVKIWDPTTGNLTDEIDKFQAAVSTLAFSPTGDRLVTGDWARNVLIWDTRSWKQLDVVKLGFDSRIWFVGFSPNGEYLAVASSRGGAKSGQAGLKVWRVMVDASSGALGSNWTLKELTQPTTNGVTSACFSPNSRLLAWYWRQPDKASTAHVWDVENGKEVFVSPPHVVGLTDNVAFCPDSEHVMFVNTDKIIETWNVTTGQRVCVFATAEPPHRPLGDVVLSRDGRWCASNSGVSVVIWDTRSRKPLLALPRERSVVYSTAWSLDSSSLAVGTADGELVIWSIPGIRKQLAVMGLGWDSDSSDPR
jgi:WD40 repeat protein